jgi:uncharacterized protein (TIGR02444 family)
MSNAANPFWEFAVAVYGQPGVEAECLSLQESGGINVILVLFAAYCGVEGLALGDGDIESCVADIGPVQSSVVRPLRNARRALKRFAPDAGEEHLYASIRERLRSAELDAERMIAARLYAMLAGRLGERPRQAAEQISPNVARLLDLTASATMNAGGCARLMLAARASRGALGR